MRPTTRWQQTLAFADQMRFGHIHIFAYSPRAGTKAAGMPGQGRWARETRTQPCPCTRSRQQAGKRRCGTLSAARRRCCSSSTCRARAGPATDELPRVELDEPVSQDLENRVLQVRCTAVSADGERLLAEQV